MQRVESLRSCSQVRERGTQAVEAEKFAYSLRRPLQDQNSPTAQPASPRVDGSRDFKPLVVNAPAAILSLGVQLGDALSEGLTPAVHSSTVTRRNPHQATTSRARLGP